MSKLGDAPIKEFLALFVAFLVCRLWNLDALSVILHGDKPRFIGVLLTAGVIAGGSKGSLKLFRDVMGVENEVAKAAREARVKKFKASLA